MFGRQARTKRFWPSLEVSKFGSETVSPRSGRNLGGAFVTRWWCSDACSAQLAQRLYSGAYRGELRVEVLLHGVQFVA